MIGDNLQKENVFCHKKMAAVYRCKSTATEINSTSNMSMTVGQAEKQVLPQLHMILTLELSNVALRTRAGSTAVLGAGGDDNRKASTRSNL